MVKLLIFFRFPRITQKFYSNLWQTVGLKAVVIADDHDQVGDGVGIDVHNFDCDLGEASGRVLSEYNSRVLRE